jgi:signal transduction histidine kinase
VFLKHALVSTVRKQKEEALSSVNYKVIEAEERERQRIANDLHEGIGQRVTLLVIQIEQLTEGSANGFDLPSRIDGILKECRQVLTDVKALAHELYSPRLEYLGIAGVMNSFCTDFRARNGVEIDFHSDGSISVVPRNVSLCPSSAYYRKPCTTQLSIAGCGGSTYI